MSYLEVTQEQGKKFYMDFINERPVIMLNLLKFREVADYSGLKEIEPEKEISGQEAYGIYMKETLPFLERAGSKILFKGAAGSYAIGPESEKWDLVLLVEHESVKKFMEFAQNKEYLKIAGHRTAALMDSRLLPIRR